MPYAAPTGRARFEQEIKRSRFIGVAAPARSDEDVRALLSELRVELPAATHYCWAAVVGDPEKSARSRVDDDGEPSGTAGRPILSVLQHKGVGDVALVVVRYFGGTKLGAGGLVRAYSSTASGVMETLPTAVTTPSVLATVTVGYADEEPVRRLLASEGVELLEARFGENVALDVRVHEGRLVHLRAALAERTAGRARLALGYSDLL